MNKGLTLVELLIAITIFGVLVTGLINLFIAAMDAQASVLQNQEMLNQSSYAIEYMDRAIRMALLDETGDCTGSANTNYGTSGGIFFLSFDTTVPLPDAYDGYRCKKFYLENNVLKEMKSSTNSAANFPASGTELTSSKLKINSLNLTVAGDVIDTSQPFVTLTMNIQSNSTRRLNPIPSMILQTSISQRNLNISE